PAGTDSAARRRRRGRAPPPRCPTRAGGQLRRHVADRVRSAARGGGGGGRSPARPLRVAPGSRASAAPGRDLSDCPLDPAQLLLDCIIDALSPETAADPLDCRPNPAPGGEGTLG